MILNITTNEFSNFDLKGQKKVFADFLGHKVNEIVRGGMTNNKWGEYYIRHEKYAYSKIRIEPTKENKMHITIYDYSTKQWIESATQ